ncbi:MAG: aldo/keto reductase, partial [Terracidiphilus sp.]
AEMLYAATEAADERVVIALGALSEARGLSPARVALAWLLSRPGVTSPIVGAGKIGHLEDAVQSLEVTLTEPEIANLEAPYIPHAASFYQEVPGSDQDR